MATGDGEKCKRCGAIMERDEEVFKSADGGYMVKLSCPTCKKYTKFIPVKTVADLIKVTH